MNISASELAQGANDRAGILVDTLQATGRVEIMFLDAGKSNWTARCSNPQNVPRSKYLTWMDALLEEDRKKSLTTAFATTEQDRTARDYKISSTRCT